MWRVAPAFLTSLLMACTYSPVPLRTGGDDVSADQDGTGDDGCEVLGDPCGTAGYDCGMVVALDSCGRMTDLACGACALPDTCGGGGAINQCGRQPWYPLGNSEFGPHAERVVWGSATGGGVSNSKLRTDYPCIAIDSLDRPVVSWEDGAVLKVARWDGAAWVGFGGSLAGIVDYGVESCLALDKDDHPVVAWRAANTAGVDQIYLRRWTGAIWEEVAGSGTGNGVSASSVGARAPALALDTDDEPVLAWFEPPHTTSRNIYMKRFDGSAWVAEHGSDSTSISASAADSSNPAVAVDSANRVLVAWVEGPAPSRIYVRRSGGNAWDSIVGSATGVGVTNGTHSSYTPSIAVDPDDHVTVAWESSGTTNWVALKHYETTWLELNGSATSPGVTVGQAPALAVNDGGYPMIASIDSVTQHLEVHRWDAIQWPELGGSAGVDNRSWGARLRPSMALDNSDNPVVAWTADPDGAGAFEIYVARWGGDAWLEYSSSTALAGGISNDTARSWNPAVAMGPALHPVVAWHSNEGGNDQIFLRAWRGNTWVELAGSASGGGVSSQTNDNLNPSVAVNAEGHPVVAWQGDGMGNKDIFVRRYNGSSWEDLAGSSSGGGVSENDTASESPSLALDDSGNPFVAWTNGSALSALTQIHLRYWNGSSWVDLGGSAGADGLSNTVGDSSAPRLVLDPAGKPVVAWRCEVSGSAQIYVARWSGTAWVGYDGSNAGGGVSNSTTFSVRPAVALDPAGHPIVAWREAASPNSILVSRFDGSSWQSLVPVYINSAPGFSIPEQLAPELVTDGAGNPIVVWRAETGTSTNIYARRWSPDDSQWHEVAGSATAGGISNSGANSFEPAVTLWSDRMCAAWSEAGRPGVEVLMRCTDL